MNNKELRPLFFARSALPTGSQLLYGGYPWDAATGLYFVRLRVFHPSIGFWIQRDPLSLALAPINEYQYASNSPLMRLDSFGAVDHSAVCRQAFPQPADVAEGDSKELLKCMAECAKDLKLPGKYRTCVMKCGGKSAKDKIKEWMIQFSCCVNHSGATSNPCKCNAEDVSKPIPKKNPKDPKEKQCFEKLPCVNPTEDGKSRTGNQATCQECCQYLAFVSAFSSLDGSPGEIARQLAGDAFEYLKCEGGCN